MAINLEPSKVSLLLHGASPIVDSGQTPKTLTAGGVTSTTAVSVLGGASLYRASGNQLMVPAHADFNMGTGDFAIEARVRRESGSGRAIFLGQCDSAGTNSSGAFVMQINASNQLEAYCVSGGTDFAKVTSSATVADGTFYTVEYSRSGTTFRLRVDGVTAATTTSSTAVNASSSKLGVFGLGEYTSGLQFQGYLDELVIFKGGLLHTADYTPANEEYALMTYALSGNVKDAANANAARAVVAILESTKTVIGSATSDATTGNYTIPTPTNDAHTLISYPAAGESLPALVLSGVIPV